ncbi:MAG: RagB/SusD family nutrient uptake outer membrane protein [Ferruginibacter sp.]
MQLNFLNKTNVVILLIAAMMAGSCKKLDLKPTDRFTEDNFWQINGNVSNALNTVYNRIYNSQRFFYNEALSDNAHAQLGVNVGTPDQIAGGGDGLFSPDLARVLSDWTYYYQGIFAANLFLENVDQNTVLPASIKDRMKGEARFIRAFHYFRLMNWYGDVPLLTKIVSVEDSRNAKRTPKAEVLKFILDELDAAAAVLPKKEDYAAADKGRVTKAAAKALKARVLLYQGNRMAEVATICEDLINNQSVNGAYNTLQTSYASIFSSANEYNAEVIFDIPYTVNVRTYDEPSRMIPISAGAQNSENYNAPTQELVNSYLMANGKAIAEAGSGYDENDPYTNRDPRLGATIVYNGYTWLNANGSTQVIYTKPGSDPNPSRLNEQGAGLHTPTGYYWRKYYDPAVISNQSTTNLILLRWSDVLLMYAEAKNSLAQMDAIVWDKTIKPIRVRAGFTDPLALNYPGNSSMTMTDLIRTERRVEFALESMRIDDIRRWKIAEIVMNGWIHGGKWGPATIDNGYLRVTERVFKPAKHYLWPIPSSEIQRDASLLPQNPGW